MYLLASIAGLVLLVAMMFLGGSRLPRDHVAAVRATYAAPPETVWALIADPDAAPAWRKDLKSVERRPNVAGRESWAEVTSSGTVIYELAESVAPTRRVTRIADESLPFGGQWEYDLSPAGSGTILTITERGFVKPAPFRFLARYVFGYTATMRDYLVALGARLGERVEPVVVASGT
jgi:hypothetical protein